MDLSMRSRPDVGSLITAMTCRVALCVISASVLARKDTVLASNARYSIASLSCYIHEELVVLVLECKKARRLSGQVRSGVAAYAGAACRRVHLATVPLRPPSCHRPGRRQARHARILQIGLHLMQPRSVRTPPRHGPATRISTRKNLMAGILRRESRHMPIEA